MPRPRSRPTPRRAAALGSLRLTSSRPAQAADATWSSPTSGRWLVPSNWSTAAVPASSDTATINTNSANVTNSGTIESRPAPAAPPPNFNYLATCAFYGTTGRTFTNTGTITVGPSSTLLLADAAAASPLGTLSLSGTALLNYTTLSPIDSVRQQLAAGSLSTPPSPAPPSRMPRPLSSSTSPAPRPPPGPANPSTPPPSCSTLPHTATPTWTE